jgi:hypothetical protein
VLNTPLPNIATHLKFLDQLPQEKVIVDFYQNPRDPFTEMSVVAYDEPQPGLLSKICGVVYAAGMDIHMAQVFTLFSQEGTRDAAAVGRLLSARHQQAVADGSSEAGTANGAAANGTSTISNDSVINKNVANGVGQPDSSLDSMAYDTNDADERGIVLDRLYVARDGRQLTSAQCARFSSLTA